MRILIIASDPLARAGLATIIAEQTDVTVVGQVASIDDIAIYQPDVVLWDLGWEVDEEDLTAFREAVTDQPGPEEGGLPFVALVPGDEFAADVWSAGTHGLLDRDADPSQITAALQSATLGLLTLTPGFGEAIYPIASPLPSPAEDLTPRESEVLQLLAQGLSNRAIALELDISEHTVKFHVNAILSKLAAQSRTEAVVKGMRMGLIVL